MKHARTKTVKWFMNAGGALLPMNRNSSVPTAKTIASVRAGIGSLLPCAGALTAAAGFAAGGAGRLRRRRGPGVVAGLVTRPAPRAAASLLAVMTAALGLPS